MASPEYEINPAARLGLDPGQAVREIGRQGDIDELLREGIEEATGRELLDPEDDTVADLVLLWFRDGEGDLEDALTHAAEALDDGGDVWLLTPADGHSGFVDPEDIAYAADAVGLTPTDSVTAGDSWSAARLAAPWEARGGWAASRPGGEDESADDTADADADVDETDSEDTI